MISVSTPSSGVIRKFTPKPAATPANAAAIPASGLRPTLLNATAPSGINTRYPASEATLETIPSSTMMNVSVLLDETADELADQRADQPGRLGQADPDHHHQDDRDRREVAEVVDERREQEAHAVDGQQAPDLGRLGLELVVVGVGSARAARRCRAGSSRRSSVSSASSGGGFDDLVGRLDVEPGEHLREHDHARGTATGTGSPGRASCCRGARSRRASAASRVLAGVGGGRGVAHASARRSGRRTSASATTAFSSSSSSTRSSGAWMLA